MAKTDFLEGHVQYTNVPNFPQVGETGPQECSLGVHPWAQALNKLYQGSTFTFTLNGSDCIIRVIPNGTAVRLVSRSPILHMWGYQQQFVLLNYSCRLVTAPND